MNDYPHGRWRAITWLLVGAVVAVLVTISVLRWWPGDDVRLGAKHQAVLLSNGAVYFGTVERASSRYLALTDVYYIQSSVDEPTKQTRSVLVKRGKESHKPTRMMINVEHVMVIEPVAADSQVAEVMERLRRE